MKNSIYSSLKVCVLSGLLAAFAAGVHAKLPPPSEEAKAKAAETALKSAWSSKVDAYLLCNAQNRVAAAYLTAAKTGGVEVKPPVPTPPCADPGAYTAVAATPAKPIEAAGAHSPAETAASPPSTKQPAATLDPVQKP